MNADKICELQNELIHTAGFLPVVKEKREIRTPEGRSIRKEYDIAVIFEDGMELNTHTFKSVKNIEYSEYWDQCCDAELDTRTKTMLKAYLQQQISKMVLKTNLFIDTLGLTTGDKIVYVYGKNAVISSNKDYSYIFADSLPDFRCKIKRSVSDMLRYAKSLILLKPGVTDILFCASLLCVIRPILLALNYPADFFLALYGESGAMKSTYAKLFFVGTHEQIMNFTMDKSKSILERIQKYSGHAVVIDDYHPAAKDYDRKRQASIMDAIARNADGGDGALAVVTSEFLAGSFSLQDRMLQVPVPKMISDNSNSETEEFLKKLTEIQKNSDILREILYEFAYRVYSDMDSVMEKLDSFIKNRKIDNTAFRIDRNIHFLYMAMSIFSNLFPEYDFKKLDEIISRSLHILKKRQSEHMAVLKRLEGCPDWTDEVFYMLNSPRIKKEYEFEKRTLAEQGIIVHDKKIYITPYVLEREMCKYLQMYVNEREIVAHLSKTQVLDEDNTSAHTKKKNGVRYYVIDRARLELHHIKKSSDADYAKDQHTQNRWIMNPIIP